MLISGISLQFLYCYKVEKGKKYKKFKIVKLLRVKLLAGHWVTPCSQGRPNCIVQLSTQLLDMMEYQNTRHIEYIGTLDHPIIDYGGLFHTATLPRRSVVTTTSSL